MLERIKELGYHALCGAVMGTADLVPGVSGGTMAWIMGIYPRLITAINVVRGDWLKLIAKGRTLQAMKQIDWALFVPLFAGLVFAVVVMVKLLGLPELIKTYPQQVYGLFFGLILGSIPLLLRSCPPPKRRFAWLVLGALIGLGFSRLSPMESADGSLVMFAAGMVAICAMLLPGVSGSFLLLMLGKYEVVLRAIDTADWNVLAPFAAGALCGIIGFAKLLQWLLDHFYEQMVWLMAGLLLGSLLKLWPF